MSHQSAVGALTCRRIDMCDFSLDSRFKGIEPLPKKLSLSSPTMHKEELYYIEKAIDSGWVTTVGENINELEKIVAEKISVKHVVGLSSGTAALHLAVKLAAEKLYGSSTGITTPMGFGTGGALKGIRVFCSDMTFAATVNPVVYEGGEPVFIDTEYETWNMSPEALEKAFNIYPDVKLVVTAHLYGTPGKIDEIKSICHNHKALLIEDAAESFGATYKGIQTGCFGDFSVISFNGNKIITGSSGGMLLTNNRYDAGKVRKWSTQSREAAPWYQHEELGYNYRMSNIIAGIARGQMKHLEEHICRKREIYIRYKEGLADLPVRMNPWDEENSVPNFWLSCLVIDQSHMCEMDRSEKSTLYKSAKERSCPSEILEALAFFRAEGRPIWKPMHMQPIYRNHGFVTIKGPGRGCSNVYAEDNMEDDVGTDIFNRGLCLPSDIKMTKKEQDVVIEVIHRCFG